MKTCYYELLDVTPLATDLELKKAYRKKALQLHPDKNPHNVEEAHHQFSLVRAAYEVLSDPQERAWYDSHKSSILNEEEVMEDEVGESHIPSISADEILRYFNPGMYTTFNDSSSGFFAIVSRLFERLAREEVQHGKYQGIEEYMKFKDDENNVHVLDPALLKFPLFGNSHAEATVIRDFYQAWSSFATVKSFNWMHEYRYSQAPDRRTRRLMERENKKTRDECRKEYNETVRKFVGFVKRRDPRYKTAMDEIAKMQKRKQTREIEEQVKRLKKLEKEQKKKKMEQDGGFVEQSWQKLDADEQKDFEKMVRDEYGHSGSDVDIDTNDDDENSSSDDISTDSEFDEYTSDVDGEIHEFECIVCDKIMKNEKQYKIHEESKKHKKAVRQMQWEMRQEGIELGIDDDGEDEFETAESSFDEVDEVDEVDEIDESEEADEIDKDELKPRTVNGFEKESKKERSILGISADLENEAHGIETKKHKQNDSCANDLAKRVTQTKYENADLSPESDVESKKDDYSTSSKNKLEEELAKLMGDTKIGDSDEDDWDVGNKKGSKKTKKKAKAKVKGKANGSENGKRSAIGTSPISREQTPFEEGVQQDTSSAFASNSRGTEKCAVCGLTFESRNQLFIHVKQLNHAAPPDSTNKISKKKKSKHK
ncbi:hypothetical protein PVL30_000247 [Lodderomyces elongisporus]|uniref:uncharacterized protein n=1 Tax=Lodderomyces elongisporus TaxID=36914 RepID=UPI002921A5BF|nr:uncharacterized protein PVL30_000247 [Lodderomyces elongisporus]WLF76545.1 hypothetical protein PVL30_000247 [Lodderomyces elongisporus]